MEEDAGRRQNSGADQLHGDGKEPISINLVCLFAVGILKLFRIRSYVFYEFLKVLKTPTKKEAGSKNSEFSEKGTFSANLANFLIKKV